MKKKKLEICVALIINIKKEYLSNRNPINFRIIRQK